MAVLDANILQLAAQQHGLITRDQFLAVGTASQLKYRTRHGMLERVHEGVYRLPGGTPSFQQRLLSACLAGGRAGVGSFRAAGRFLSLPAGDDVVEVTTRRHSRLQCDGVIVHESRHLSDRDVIVMDGIPITNAARTLCDLAGLVERRQLDRELLDLSLLEAVRRDLVSVRSVWQTRDRLGGSLRLGGDIILDALERFVPPVRPTESTAESRLLQLIRAHDLPEPVAQHALTLADGSRIRLDFAWPAPRVGLEFDSYKYHGDRDKHMADAARTLELQAIGWTRVSVTDDELGEGIPRALAALGVLLAPGRL